MKKGDTVELLVNYGLHYEDIRERKGYGLKNQREGLGGDAEDKAARMQRNFHEREQAEQDIVDIGFIEVRKLDSPNYGALDDSKSGLSFLLVSLSIVFVNDSCT